MKYLKLILSLMIIVILSAFTVINESTMIGDGYKVGDIATDFKLKNIDDKLVSLADFKDAKGFIIVFTL